MTDENNKKLNSIILENTKKALEKNGFKTEIFENKQEATEYILKLIGKEKKVGMGGSVTANQLELPEKLKENKNIIIKHQPQMNLEERRKIWLNSLSSDFYIASPQAITTDGKLIFIDGTGNRCAAITWGPKYIILPAGINKIVKNEQEGFWRMRNISAIANNFRLNKNNPCMKTGKCEDCSSPDRICNVVTLLWKKPKVTNYLVILINEELGY